MEGFVYSKSAFAGRILLKDLFAGDTKAKIGETVTVGGWVKTGREQGKGAFAFLHVSDGTHAASLQVIIDKNIYDLKKVVPTGTSICVKGKLVESQGNEQNFELQCSEVLYVGVCDPKKYPLSKKGHSLAFLRSIAHIRPRSNLFAAVFRVRNALANATHLFFQQRNFYYVHSPLITASDCEGAGELFQVTTLLPHQGKPVKDFEGPSPDLLQSLRDKVQDAGNLVKELKDKKASKEEIKAAVDNLLKVKKDLAELELTPIKIGGVPQTLEKTVDYSRDFFGAPTYLTVSGQLQAEVFACAMSNVYTFGPTFRAEDSHTNRHLAEFWMIEPEIAFADIHDCMQCAEDYVRFCASYVLEHNLSDLESIDEFHAFELKQTQQQGKKQGGAVKEEETRSFTEPAVVRVRAVAESNFKRISYTEAVEILISSGKTFVEPVSWGIDLSSEHERYLAEEVFKGPTIVYNYPRDIKAFYMRQNDDGKTVAAMDVLFPQIGELIGGSQREERIDVLENRLKELNLQPEDFSWYLDLRRYGSVPHSGFGLGFERLIMFATGIENIRDVSPFPRFPGSCNF